MGEKRLGSEIKDETPHNGDPSLKAERWEGIALQRNSISQGEKAGKKRGFYLYKGGGSLRI